MELIICQLVNWLKKWRAKVMLKELQLIGRWVWLPMLHTVNILYNEILQRKCRSVHCLWITYNKKFGMNLSKGRRVIHSEQAQRKFQEVQEVLNASRLFSQVKREVLYICWCINLVKTADDVISWTALYSQMYDYIGLSNCGNLVHEESEQFSG